ncbi:hypothetical protein VM1G_02117 [Cytospora mali]|uniref:Uncharacterized protein n=1 Tax=Cytospora mali TaxID=578113 RepID=A0A194VR32_CYTMA|nr:hypothetical protein VM1G_02117 [Valsa mali]
MHRFRHRSEGTIPQSDESLSRIQSSTELPGIYLPPEPDPTIDTIPTSGIMTSTCFDIPGHRIERSIGTIYGMSVRSRGLLPGMGAGLKTLAGGDIGAVTKLMYRTRNDAIARLVAECQKREANAVVGLRFETSQLADGMALVCAYGTAVHAVRVDPARGPDVGLAPMAELADRNQGTFVGAGLRNAHALDLAEGRI